MKRHILVPCLTLAMLWACTKPQEVPDSPLPPSVQEDSLKYCNASFCYKGDDIGDEFSDCWLLKFWSDMESDESGAPIGPGELVQLLLNSYYNPAQEANPAFLTGRYQPMSNSGSFSPYTFLNGYSTSIEVPGGKLTVYDGSYWGSLEEGSDQINYDLADEGDFTISKKGDSLFVKGWIAGEKFRKRHFEWKGVPSYVDEAEKEIPSSTLSAGLELNDLCRAQLKDEGDIFDMFNPKRKFIRLYLADSALDISANKPKGNGKMLRLELQVDLDWDISKGLPDGDYPIVELNENGYFNSNDLVPGIALSGTPGYFNEPYLSGAWFIEWKNDIWSKNYACLTSGKISVRNSSEGCEISFELYDCLEAHNKVSGKALIDNFIIL